MSEELLKQILNELKEIKGIVSDVPLIRQAVLETNEIVKRLESNQERQERILELLSVRSIEQEADIKRLR